MFKKLLIVTGLITLGSFVLNKDSRSKAKDGVGEVVAYVKSVVKSKRHGVESSTDAPEKKLYALRGRLKDLDVEISATKDRLAQRIVESSHAAVEVTKLRDVVDTGTKVLTARAKEIDDARTELVGYAGSPMPVPAARKRLDRDLELVAAQKTLLAETEDAARQQEDGVSLLRQHVAELETLKLEAKTKLDVLDLELKKLRMHEVKDRFEANDTKAGQFLDDLKELEKMIEVKKVRRSLDPKPAPAAAAELSRSVESATDAVARKLGLTPEKKIEKAGD
jgi:hypothetical protein